MYWTFTLFMSLTQFLTFEFVVLMHWGVGVPPAVRCEGGVMPQTSCHDEDLTTVHTPHAWPIQCWQLAYCVRLWTVSGNQSHWWESTGRHRKNMQGGREWNLQPLYLSGLIDKPTGLLCALVLFHDASSQTLLDVMNLRSHLDKSRRDLTRRDTELRLVCVGAQSVRVQFPLWRVAK